MHCNKYQEAPKGLNRKKETWGLQTQENDENHRTMTTITTNYEILREARV